MMVYNEEEEEEEQQRNSDTKMYFDSTECI